MNKKICETLNPEVNDFYEIITLPESPEAWCVKLIKGKWKNLIYTYGKIVIKEQNKKLLCKVEHEILYIPENLKGLKFSKKEENEYKTLIGKIAMNILYENDGKLKPMNKDSKKLILEK